MKYGQIMPLLKQKITGIVLFGLLIAALSFLTLVIRDKNFKASTDYLIVQNQGVNQDFRTLSKSAEYTAKVLKESIRSELFLNEVLKTGKVSSEFLPFNKKERLGEWSWIVKMSQDSDSATFSVRILNNDQSQALAISSAISDVLVTKNNLFLGEGHNVAIRVLSGPMVEKNPTIANIVGTAIAGFILGILLGALWIVLREDRRKKEIFSQPRMSMHPGTHSRMEIAGNFMSDEEYRESLKYIDK
jgi:capsular polysaccharide biosynthesis protein